MTIETTISPDALWNARRKGAVLPPPERVWSEDEAYAVQEALIESAGMPIAGWKVGATAVGAPGMLGISGPLSGPIWPNALAHNGDEISLFAVHRPQAEVEFAVRFDRSPDGSDEASIFGAIDAVALAIEIPCSRLMQETVPPGPGYIADHGGSGHVAIGPWVRPPAVAEWPSVSARLLVNDQVRKTGMGGHVLGTPFAALLWLVGHLWRRGRSLSCGDVVITGAMVGLTPFSIGASLGAEADGLPPLHVRTLEAR
ncbi:MAG: fumarylacetoacetate hydrolase family protein [Pseudomonadota bacterium]